MAGGRTATERDAVAWAREGVERGAGEILLTSMDRDGTSDGYDLALTEAVSAAVGVPVIASGGAGTLEHLVEALAPAPTRPCARRSSTTAQFTIAQAKAHLGGAGRRRAGSELACGDRQRGRRAAATRRPGDRRARAGAPRRRVRARRLAGCAPRELDLVIEGDALAFARALGGARVVHDRFGTATASGRGWRVDVARRAASATRRPARCRWSSRRPSRRTCRGATSPSTRSP